MNTTKSAEKIPVLIDNIQQEIKHRWNLHKNQLEFGPDNCNISLFLTKYEIYN